MTPNHYHTMTDEQLAQWHQLTTRVEQLTRELALSRRAMEDYQAVAEQECMRLRSALTNSADVVMKLTKQLVDQKSANHRLCAAQVALLKALEALVRWSDGMRVDADTAPYPEEWEKAVREAREVLALNSIPF